MGGDEGNSWGAGEGGAAGRAGESRGERGGGLALWEGWAWERRRFRPRPGARLRLFPRPRPHLSLLLLSRLFPHRLSPAGHCPLPVEDSLEPPSLRTRGGD